MVPPAMVRANACGPRAVKAATGSGSAPPGSPTRRPTRRQCGSKTLVMENYWEAVQRRPVDVAFEGSTGDGHLI